MAWVHGSWFTDDIDVPFRSVRSHLPFTPCNSLIVVSFASFPLLVFTSVGVSTSRRNATLCRLCSLQTTRNVEDQGNTRFSPPTTAINWRTPPRVEKTAKASRCLLSSVCIICPTCGIAHMNKRINSFAITITAAAIAAIEMATIIKFSYIQV